MKRKVFIQGLFFSVINNFIRVLRILQRGRLNVDVDDDVEIFRNEPEML